MKKYVITFALLFIPIVVLGFILHAIIIPEESFTAVAFPIVLLGLTVGSMFTYALNDGKGGD